MRILSPRQYLRPLLMCAASLGAASLSFSQSLTITSGQGQIVQNASVATQTLAVQLLDATGKPFPGQTVTFADTQGGSAGIATPNFAVTDSNGMAFTTFISNNIPLGNTVNYTQTNIIASYGGLSAVFTETTSATAPTGGSAVLVNVGSPQIGQLLTGGAGSTSSIPVKVQVTTLFSSLGIPNVAVSLRSNSTNTPLSAARRDLSYSRTLQESRLALRSLAQLETVVLQSSSAVVFFISTSPFQFVTSVGPPGIITITGGANQSGLPGDRLALPITATVPIWRET